jgi:type I restriction enzyme, S subunit
VSKIAPGWSVTTIAEITEYLSRGKQPKYVSNSSLPVINQKAIRLSGIQTEYLKYVDPDQFDHWTPERFIRNGDVLCNSTGTGTLGRVCLITQRDLTPLKVVDSHVTIIRPDQSVIDPLFLFSWIQSEEAQESIANLATGATNQIELSRAAIASIHIPIAPLNEQKRIAGKLDTLFTWLDKCRDRLDRIPLILKRFRQSVLSAAITGELTEDWRVSINRSFDSWQETSSGSIFPYITSGSRGWAKYYSQEGALFLRVGNLDHETIELDLKDPQYVMPPSGAEGKRTRIEVGDILISITADIGMVAFIREDIGEAYINQHLCLARQTGEYLGAYLAYYLASPLGGVLQLKEMQRGVTKTGLTLGDIRAITFLMPELDEQEEIVRRIEQLFDHANLIEECYKKAFVQVEQIKPTLLNMAFRGELVPQDPDDEPVSVLLERIQIEKAAQPIKPKVTTTKRSAMTKLSQEFVKDVIHRLPNDKFSFDELREEIQGDYDLLKDILFTLLGEVDPIVIQVFDKQEKTMYFMRGGK